VNKILSRVKQAYKLETDAEVAEFLNMNPSTLSMQKNRGKLDLWRILNKCENVNRNWLLDGEGPMWRDQVVQSRVEQEGIPIFSTLSFAPDGSVKAEESTVVNRIFANGNTPEYLRPYHSNRLMGYIIDTEAMHPTIKKNDVVIIDIEDKQPHDGAVYLTSGNHSVACRRLEVQSPESYGIHTDSRQVQTKEATLEEQDLQLVGKVIWLIQHLYDPTKISEGGMQGM